MDQAKRANIMNRTKPNQMGHQVTENGAVDITDREQEVLQLLCEGLTTKEIATSLHISSHTVVSHKKNLMEKEGARNTVQMVCRAFGINF